MSRPVWAFGLLAVLGTAAFFFVRPSASAASPRGEAGEVKIDNFSFGPETITVPRGATVSWTNHDDIPHAVAADDKSFKSRVLDTNEKFSHTFDKPGTYPYFCSLHPKMTGKVVVH
jgi:plastocyanin